MDEASAAGAATGTHDPYARPQAELLAPPLPAAVVASSASRWLRLGARLLDQLIAALAFIPAIVALAVGEHGGGVWFMAGLALTGVLLVALFVVNLIGLDRTGQTLGKRLVGIRILRRDGSHPTLGRSFGLRSFVPGLIAMFVGPFGLLDALWIFGDERRCLHDLMADTVVVPAR